MWKAIAWMSLVAVVACREGGGEVQKPTVATPRIVAPAEVLSGDEVGIVVEGFAPGEIEISAERVVVQVWAPGQPRQLYRASAKFVVGGDGRVVLARDAPVAGSYAGADVRGLFWSMVPTEEPVGDGWQDGEVRLAAEQRGVSARGVMVLRAVDPKIEIVKAGAELPGAVLARLPGGKRPVIIALGGSEGGDWFAKTMAPRLASHGYAVLGMPYYVPAYAGPPGEEMKALPTAFAEIPVDRLEQAREWLRKQDVDVERLGIYGVSKGAEFALIAATRMAGIKAVVAIAPSDVVWEGWGVEGAKSSFAWKGEGLPFVPHGDLDGELAKVRTGGKAHLVRPQQAGRAAHPEAAIKARIPIETFRGELLVAGGGDDQVWASAPMTQAIERSRAAAGLKTTALVYAEAGHLLSGDGWSPTTQIAMSPFAVGGTPVATARAQAQVWRETLGLLERALKPAVQ